MAADMNYDSRSVANYLIAKAKPIGLDALQVLKLTYISHGFVLGFQGKPLLEDDVEAWKLGPVIRSIYSALPGGAESISAPIGGVQPATLDGKTKNIVDMVYDTYGKYNGLFLSNLTHRPGSPWKKTWTTYGRNAVIPRDLIREHYSHIITAWQRALEDGREYYVEAL